MTEAEIIGQIIEAGEILEVFDAKYSIPKHPQLDNEVYYPVYSSDKRYLHVYGGRGSGKSFEIEGKYPLVLISCLPFARVAMIRQYYNSIKNSQFQEIYDYIQDWKLHDYFEVRQQPMRITCIENGNYITFHGLDKPDSFKSLKDVTHAVFGEALQIKSKEAITKIDKSIRTPKLKHQTHKVVFTYNTDSTSNPIHEMFHEQDEESAAKFKHYRDESFYLKTTYQDNKHLPPNFIAMFEAEAQNNPQQYAIDGLGEWGNLEIEGMYYDNFDSFKNVQHGLRAKYDPSKPLLVSFDFNVWPYIALNVHQIYTDPNLKALTVAQIDEVHVEDEGKQGKVDHAVKELLNRYGDKQIGDLLIFGDRSGHNRKTNAPPDYSTVFSELRAYKRKNRANWGIGDKTNTFNPKLNPRRIFFRRIHSETLQVLPPSRNVTNARGQVRPLSASYGGWKVLHKIDSKCKNSIKDYTQVQADIGRGGKITADKRLTHASDSSDYLFTTLFDVEFNHLINKLKYKEP